jgi:ribonuclease VapC
MSAVNFAEVQGKLMERGMQNVNATAAIIRVVRDFEPFDFEQAAYAGSLITMTKALGLSLGDRCCLALAFRLKAPVYTTDKSWKTLQLGFPIHVIR